MFNLVDIFGYLSVILRAGTLVAQSLLLGGIVFLFWIARPNAAINAEALERSRASARRMLLFAAIALALLQVGYLYVNSAVLIGTSDMRLADVAGAVFFIAGSVMLAGSVLVALLAKVQSRSGAGLLCLAVLGVFGASVMTNHAAARIDGRALLLTLTIVHEAATGFWIGGLPFLALGLYVVRKDSPTQWYLTQRFSRLALVSVILLVFSGIGLTFKYVGSLHGLVGTSYGIMIIAKIMMLVAMLALGGINFLLLRRYQPGDVIPRLRRLVEAEVGIGITIILSAASLTSQPPAIDLVDDTVQPSHIVARFRPEWPGMKSPNESDLSTLYPGRDASEDPARKIVAYTSEGKGLSQRIIADMQWSEYNHHWLGLIVVAMGLLALLARTGHAPWAEYWPLMMIGIAIFIFLRGDPECWPLGPRPFWATWSHPEIAQHRAAAILCIAFAIFELRVRRNPNQRSMLPLIFPLLCAVGAALLLTHSHGTTNVKEESLAELSHMPLGVLGVMAGWSRWLELRLPEEDRAIPSWIWPVCFVLIGAGLMNYREL
jgi:putative copper resistance protein D